MIKKILVALSLFVTYTSIAQDKTKSLDSLFNQRFGEGKFYGNVLMAEKGQVIYEKSFGMADHSGNLPLNKESIFELASVSKQFTAMGIMLLNKMGKLNYEDSLRKFIPELPYFNITVRNLLNHTSGLPDYIALFAEHWDPARIATNKDIIEMLAKYKPAVLSGPGVKFEYSNTGYAVLASVIEKLSGETFAEFLSKNIFRPLNMNRTSVFSRRFEKKGLDNYAYGYVPDKNKNFVLPDSLPEYKSMVYTLDGIQGDGTINSTTGDLFKWDRALYTGQLLDKNAMSEAFKPAVLADGKKSNYGFGWFIDSSAKFGLVYSHSGGWPGYNTLIERHTDSDKTIIILRNHETSSLNALGQVKNILYGIQAVIPTSMKLDEQILKKYIGEFQLDPGFSLVITTDNGKIYAQGTGQDILEIFPEKEDWFFLKVVEAKIQFLKDEKGNVRSLNLHQNEKIIPASKIN